MTPAEMRDAIGRFTVEKEIIRQHPHLSPSATKRLADAAAECSAFRAHVYAGEPLAMAECLDAAHSSEIAKLIFAPRDGDRGEATMPAGMTPHQQLTWARANGIKQ